MSPMDTIATLITGSGVLIALLSVPLILRRIPPNSLYGIRTKASFHSEADWYRINATGGRYLSLAGMVIALIGLVGFFLPGRLFVPYATVAASVTLLAVVIPCIRLTLMRPSGGQRGPE